MYMKKGQVFNSPEVKDNEHFLQNDEGKVYQVSETVLFDWDKLDGKTKMDDILIGPRMKDYFVQKSVLLIQIYPLAPKNYNNIPLS